MLKKINVGIIGLGHMGLLHFFSCLKLNSIVEVIGIADKSKNIRNKYSKYNINMYEDYHNLIDKEDLDCIIISLPNFVKKDCVKYASENSLDIFLDKPLGKNYEEAIEISHYVQKNGIRLMVGSNYRYHPNIRKVKNLYDDGRIGDIHLADFELIMNGPFSHPLVPIPISEWYIDPERAGGGALLDLGYHLIDLDVWFFGVGGIFFSHLDNILNLPVEDSVTIVIQHKERGLLSTVNAGWFSKIIFPEFNFRVNLHGTAGYLSTEKYSPKFMRLNAINEALKNTLKKIMGKEINYLSYTYYYSSFFEIMRDFLSSIKSGEDLSVSLKDQVEVMRLIDEAYSNNKNMRQ